MSNLATVQEIYAAFGRGDVPAILGKLADDVAWEQWTGGNSAADRGVAHLMPRTGPAEVGEFFASLQGLEFHGFEPTGFLEGGNQVAALIRTDMTIKASGHRFQDDEVHLWTFDDAGRVVQFRHFVDTGKHFAGAPAH